jgi:hypothetical protein
MIAAWPTTTDPGRIQKGRAASNGGAAFFVLSPREILHGLCGSSWNPAKGAMIVPGFKPISAKAKPD